MHQQAYTSSRPQDVVLEQSVAKFLDENFYSRVGVPFERKTDRESQFAGIDVVLDGHTIDEKVKVKGDYLSKVLDYPSFEMSFLSQYDGSVSDGWFVKNGMKTDYYAFISVFSDVSDWKSVRFDNITSVTALFVLKKDVVEFIDKCDSFEYVKSAAKLLREMAWMGEEAKRFPHRKFHLKLSNGYPEKPINLVFKRETLKSLPHTRELEITESGRKRI